MGIVQEERFSQAKSKFEQLIQLPENPSSATTFMIAMLFNRMMQIQLFRLSEVSV